MNIYLLITERLNYEYKSSTLISIK